VAVHFQEPLSSN